MAFSAICKTKHARNRPFFRSCVFRRWVVRSSVVLVGSFEVGSFEVLSVNNFCSSYNKPTPCKEHISVWSVKRNKMVISRPRGQAQRNCFRTLPVLLCPLQCANTIGIGIFYSSYRQSMTNKKNPRIFVYWHSECALLRLQARWVCPASPKSAGFSWELYIPPIFLALCCSYRLTYFSRTRLLIESQAAFTVYRTTRTIYHYTVFDDVCNILHGCSNVLMQLYDMFL